MFNAREGSSSDVSGFRKHLENSGLSPKTVELYVWTVTRYKERYSDCSHGDLDAYRGFLIARFKPKTVNLRIQAVNRYLDYCGLREHRLKQVKAQQAVYLENVISDADYRYLKRCLRNDGRMTYYFAVWFMAATGARVSELLELKVEHVRTGYVDMYSKGGKMRRLYIPRQLQCEAMEWIEHENWISGFLFRNRRGERITANGLARQLKTYGEQYGLDRNVVYPHSFRHLFARNFLDVREDIALLADLMGHSSIETTRIYLRKTASEQRAVVEEVVTW